MKLGLRKMGPAQFLDDLLSLVTSAASTANDRPSGTLAWP